MSRGAGRAAINERGVWRNLCWRLEEEACALVARQEKADLGAQIGLSPASRLEEGRALLGRSRESLVKQLLGLPPPLPVDGHRRSPPPRL
jgi:hypothetical protein